MWKYISKYFPYIKSKKVRYKIPAHYSIIILNNKEKLSYIDIKFMLLLDV